VNFNIKTLKNYSLIKTHFSTHRQLVLLSSSTRRCCLSTVAMTSLSSKKKGLDPGQKFLTWVVMDRVGAGAFGEVYRVRGSSGQIYALKTEHCDAEHNVLMMDVTVLQDAGRQQFKHFAKIYESGRYVSFINFFKLNFKYFLNYIQRNDFFYLVMTLLGKSLHDLRKARKSEHFTTGTAIGSALQTLEAIEELHKIGYLHRDVKPGNYSVGLSDRKGDIRNIYILDFGMCRRYVREDNTLRRPRSAAGFRGTPRYAALRCHMVRTKNQSLNITNFLLQNMEYCRADDVESWVSCFLCFQCNLLFFNRST
jgi:tau tubulin kinase